MKSQHGVVTDLLLGVPTAKQLRLQIHLIKRVDGLIVVRLDLSCIALSAAKSGSRVIEWHRAAWKDWAGGRGAAPWTAIYLGEGARGASRVDKKTTTDDSNNVEHTLRDILETLVGSHDCDVVTIKLISRSKPGLDLEMQSLKAVDGGATRKKSAGRLKPRDRRKWTRSRKKDYSGEEKNRSSVPSVLQLRTNESMIVVAIVAVCSRQCGCGREAKERARGKGGKISKFMSASGSIIPSPAHTLAHTRARAHTHTHTHPLMCPLLPHTKSRWGNFFSRRSSTVFWGPAGPGLGPRTLWASLWLAIGGFSRVHVSSRVVSLWSLPIFGFPRWPFVSAQCLVPVATQAVVQVFQPEFQCLQPARGPERIFHASHLY